MTKTLIPLEVQLRVRGFKDGAAGYPVDGCRDHGDDYYRGYKDGRLARQRYFEQALKETQMKP